MSVHDLVFTGVAVVGAAAAVAVVTAKNLVHAALYLAVTLASTAGVFLVLGADFLGMVQLIVYVGAVVVLLLFGLMLTRAPVGREALDSQNRALGLAVAVGLFVVLTVLIVDAFGTVRAAVSTALGPREIGRAIFADWVVPFELASMLLLAALIGSVALARREEGESGEHIDAVAPELSTAPEPDADLIEAGVALEAGDVEEEVEAR